MSNADVYSPVNGYELKVIVPAGELVGASVQSAILPTAKGNVQILPLHADYTALLGTGVMEYQPKGSTTPARLVISGGFLDFSSGVLKILADSAYTPETVDKDSYAKERLQFEEKLKDGDTRSPEWITTKKKLDTMAAIDLLLSR